MDTLPESFANEATSDLQGKLVAAEHLRARNVEIKPDEYLRIECYPAKMGKDS